MFFVCYVVLSFPTNLMFLIESNVYVALLSNYYVDKCQIIYFSAIPTKLVYEVFQSCQSSGASLRIMKRYNLCLHHEILTLIHFSL